MWTTTISVYMKLRKKCMFMFYLLAFWAVVPFPRFHFLKFSHPFVQSIIDKINHAFEVIKLLLTADSQCLGLFVSKKLSKPRPKKTSSSTFNYLLSILVQKIVFNDYLVYVRLHICAKYEFFIVIIGGDVLSHCSLLQQYKRTCNTYW